MVILGSHPLLTFRSASADQSMSDLPPQHAHEWLVFSTALDTGSLLVRCRACGALGTVERPSAEEWQRAFTAPSAPYPWTEPDRVTVRRTGPTLGGIRLETPGN